MVFRSKYQESIPLARYKNSLSEFYWERLDQFSEKTLLVDYVSRREWTGKEIKLRATQLAEFLVDKLKLEMKSCCYFLTINNDYMQVAAIGCILAGCSVFSSYPGEPKTDLLHQISQLEPRVIFISTGRDLDLIIDMVSSQQIDASHLTICLMDDNKYVPEALVKHKIAHVHLLADLWGAGVTVLDNFHPPEVEPDFPAYILYTSGTTGLPKPVARTHKNSLYVAHSLDTTNGGLWHLDSNSVMAGHLQLDHGTGTFSIKMCLSKGFKLIVMDGYSYDTMVDAIAKYEITDIMLGSALLHQLITAIDFDRTASKLKSLKNLIAVGSPIASHQAAVEFMNKHGSVSVRQAFGSTECGFISIVPPTDCRQDSRSVGYLLPNIEIRLVERNTDDEFAGSASSSHEISEANVQGEMQVRGPTVVPGYMCQSLVEESKLSFLEDGFYRTNDVSSITSDGKLTIHGRFSDMLCLYDGWKCLPGDIERVLIEHEGVEEVGVIGIPHPELPTCHAPRAYVVPTAHWVGRLTGTELHSLAKAKLRVFKQLVGGIVILPPGERLPRGSLQKLDRKQLYKRYSEEIRPLH